MRNIEVKGEVLRFPMEDRVVCFLAVINNNKFSLLFANQYDSHG